MKAGAVARAAEAKAGAKAKAEAKAEAKVEAKVEAGVEAEALVRRRPAGRLHTKAANKTPDGSTIAMRMTPCLARGTAALCRRRAPRSAVRAWCTSS